MLEYCLCESILVWPKINVIDAKYLDKYKAWVLKNVLHPWIRGFYIKDLVHKLILKTQIHVCLFFCIRKSTDEYPKNPCEIPWHQALNHSLLMILTYFQEFCQDIWSLKYLVIFFSLYRNVLFSSNFVHRVVWTVDSYTRYLIVCVFWISTPTTTTYHNINIFHVTLLLLLQCPKSKHSSRKIAQNWSKQVLDSFKGLN